MTPRISETHQWSPCINSLLVNYLENCNIYRNMEGRDKERICIFFFRYNFWSVLHSDEHLLSNAWVTFKMCEQTRLHKQYQPFWSDFNCRWTESTEFSKMLKYPTSWEPIKQFSSSYIHRDRNDTVPLMHPSPFSLLYSSSPSGLHQLQRYI